MYLLLFEYIYIYIYHPNTGLKGTGPDVITAAKALGGGVPIGAMLCKDHCNVFGPGDHASTYGGNPLACAAGLAVSNALDGDGFLSNVQARGEQTRASLSNIAAKLPGVIKDIRGWGLINGIYAYNFSNIWIYI